MKCLSFFRLAALSVIFLSSSRCFAQNIPIQVGTSIPKTDIGFRQDLNTYNWLYGFSYGKRFANKFEISALEEFNSSMLRIGRGQEKWKDDQKLSLIGAYPLTPSLKLAVQSFYTDFSDQQSGFRNDIRTTYLGGGGYFTPSPKVDITATIGGKWDDRFDRHDSGINYGLDLKTRQLELSGYSNTAALAIGGDRFSVRQNRDLNAHYGVYRKFAPGTSDSLSVVYEKRRRDNYYSILGDIETYEEQVRGLRNLLNYRILPGLQCVLSNAILFKDIEVMHHRGAAVDDQRRREDRRFDHWLGLHYRRSNYTTRVRLSYSSQDQYYNIPVPDATSPFSTRAAFVAPDNESSRFSLLNETNIKISASDSIAARISSSLFRYDTPDTSNFDDRDELRLSASVMHQHRFSAAMKLQLIASVNLYHMVYIFAEHSADNNWNRIFHLMTRFFYRPNRQFRLYQSFEVLANYIDYDFESELEQTRSFAFRKFVADDSLRWDVSRRSQLYVHLRVLLEENGRLYWDEWSERPLISKTNIWAKALWKYSFFEDFSVASGVLFYTRQGWRFTSMVDGVYEKEINEEYISWGPLLRVEYTPSNQLQVGFRGSRQRIEPMSRSTYYINTLDLYLNWYF